MSTSLNPNCPSIECKNSPFRSLVIKAGHFNRQSDSKKVQRYKCKSCQKYFSKATSSKEYRFKVRREIPLIFKLYTSNLSIRRIAIILKLNRKTVVRKINYLALKAREENLLRVKALRNNPIKEVQFDDLITSEHTKMKPLSVSLAVDKKTREIIGFKVARIPAFGLLAEKSRKKYGRRVNEHSKKLESLFDEIKEAIHPNAILESDEHKLYPSKVKKFFPKSTHIQYKGGRGCVAGQGELKKKHFDPLFSLNHTCAMLRANIN